MLDRVRKHAVADVARRSAVPQVPVKMLLSCATLASFAWLLSQDMVQPLVMYALQLYLSF